MRRLLTLSMLAILAFAAFASTASARSGDRDGDRLPDRWEKRHHISTKAKSARQDLDRDGLTNLGEFRSKTDPRDADSDDDGVRDANEDRDHDGVRNGDEIHRGTNPCDRDSDDDGVDDADEVSGEIVSFEGGTLTIKRADGSTVSGMVTATTRLVCRTTAARTSHDGGSDDGVADPSCTTAALSAGAKVHEAELAEGVAPAAFKKVKILRAAA